MLSSNQYPAELELWVRLLRWSPPASWEYIELDNVTFVSMIAMYQYRIVQILLCPKRKWSTSSGFGDFGKYHDCPGCPS